MDLTNCKKSLHQWKNLLSTEHFWGDSGQNIDWCPICGTVRGYDTYDGRKVGENDFYYVPKAAIELNKKQQDE